MGICLLLENQSTRNLFTDPQVECLLVITFTATTEYLNRRRIPVFSGLGWCRHVVAEAWRT